MVPQELDDATTRYLERVSADILGLLGPGIELTELTVDVEVLRTVTLRATYQLAAETGESIGRGLNLIEAHACLRAAVIGDRIGLGLRVLV